MPHSLSEHAPAGASSEIGSARARAPVFPGPHAGCAVDLRGHAFHVALAAQPGKCLIVVRKHHAGWDWLLRKRWTYPAGMRVGNGSCRDNADRDEPVVTEFIIHAGTGENRRHQTAAGKPDRVNSARVHAEMFGGGVQEAAGEFNVA